MDGHGKAGAKGRSARRGVRTPLAAAGGWALPSPEPGAAASAPAAPSFADILGPVGARPETTASTFPPVRPDAPAAASPWPPSRTGAQAVTVPEPATDAEPVRAGRRPRSGRLTTVRRSATDTPLTASTQDPSFMASIPDTPLTASTQDPPLTASAPAGGATTLPAPPALDGLLGREWKPTPEGPLGPDGLPGPDEQPAQDAEPPAPRRRARLPRLSGLRRRLGVPRVLDRPLVLVATAVVALLAGVGAGAVKDLVTPGAPATSPEQCALAQVAWTESATRQVGMSADDPATLRAGFLGAHAALDGVAPPAAIAADWNTVKRYVDTVAAALEPVDPKDGPATTVAVGTALAGLDTAATTAASARVTAYLQADCTG